METLTLKLQARKPEEYIDLLKLQLDLQDKYAADLPRSLSGLHRKIYVKGFRGAGELRNQLMNT